MARFSVYAIAGISGYVVDVQHDILEDIATRVVVPLVPVEGASLPERRLNPLFTIEDERVMLLPQQIAAIPKALLKQPVQDLSADADKITAAIDFLMQGF